MNILTAEQFDTDELHEIFDSAQVFMENVSSPKLRRDMAQRYVGHQLCSLFYEPSTRTRLSFEGAAAKFGMGVVSTENAAHFSSAAKGETLEDSIRVIDEYNFDVIVLRHPDTGSAAHAAAVSSVPIINAGDGKGEHPTQALLDTFTIRNYHKRLDGLNVVIGGDLKHGRTARSLATMLSKFPDNNLTFVSVPELQMGSDILDKLKEHGTKHEETTEVYDALRTADVVYWTRLQKERMAKKRRGGWLRNWLANGTTAGANSYTLDQSALEVLPESAIIMHPLPRVGEITTDVDKDPRAVYFKQAGFGLYTRMALIDRILASRQQSALSESLMDRVLSASQEAARE
jgi:aspartate carbamoyltransferase catalytic subunit